LLAGLREERQRQCLTLRDLAERTGIDEPALSRLETGKNLNPTWETLARVAKALGLAFEVGLKDRLGRTTMQQEMTQYQVSVAAEGIAAALLARAGFHVSVQYGANQPGYDLIVEKDKKAFLVSVKGSQHGAWGLTQSYLRKGTADYSGAVDEWLRRHGEGII